VASVAGNETRHGINRDAAVHGFAPVSSEAKPARAGEELDRFDLLISTDVLAEGMNLQECRNIVNYDLPWNPMRLVQRHGRIDRIGSPHRRVFLRTYFPDAQLDRLLELEMRVRRKLAQAAASVGLEVAPIEAGAHREQSFAETREEIERLAQGDPSLYERGGTAGAVQTGEEYRQELRRARGQEPWKTLLQFTCVSSRPTEVPLCTRLALACV
jgi:superfamily II DNA/RNA helicase